MKTRTISSALTCYMKFILPAIWIPMFGLGTVGLFLGLFRGPGNEAPEEWMKWLFLVLWIAGSSFLWWRCVPLKKVRIAADGLYVSNYRKEVRVAYNAIRDVTENRWMNIHPVTIQFRMATEFGDSIVFMPKKQLFGCRTHPVVSELRELARP